MTVPETTARTRSMTCASSTGMPTDTTNASSAIAARPVVGFLLIVRRG
jgi:hypothetical protein